MAVIIEEVVVGSHSDHYAEGGFHCACKLVLAHLRRIIALLLRVVRSVWLAELQKTQHRHRWNISARKPPSLSWRLTARHQPSYLMTCLLKFIKPTTSRFVTIIICRHHDCVEEVGGTGNGGLQAVVKYWKGFFWGAQREVGWSNSLECSCHCLQSSSLCQNGIFYARCVPTPRVAIYHLTPAANSFALTNIFYGISQQLPPTFTYALPPLSHTCTCTSTDMCNEPTPL